MNHALLVLNAGSSSLKFSLYRDSDDTHCLLCRGQIAALADGVMMQATNGADVSLLEQKFDSHSGPEDWPGMLLNWVEEKFPHLQLKAAAHRVVHGGTHYNAPTVIDKIVLLELHRLIPLAPLHQPYALAAIAALAHSHSSLLQIACFDTAFHHTLPVVEQSFAIPRAMREAGLRRYGFHGLSYEYIVGQLPALLGSWAAGGRVVIAHLGAGASMCALSRGRSIATTMSMTPLDGLPMATRCGEIDPGAVLYLLQEKGMSANDVADLLYHKSGLLGLSGISADMRVLLDSNERGASEAIDFYVYRIVRELGSLAAALGGLDALVFTGGIGEHAAMIRQRVCEGAAWLGLSIDSSSNASNGPRITGMDSRVSAWVISTDEDEMIMRHSRRLLDSEMATPKFEKNTSIYPPVASQTDKQSAVAPLPL